MTNVAVILAGCGHLDGAEIRESVFTLLALDKAGAKVKMFAPSTPQMDVVNHITKERMNETRNVLVEAARIARGDIFDLADLKVTEFEALILPGGFGVAKNLSTLATEGADLTILPEYKRAIQAFHAARKPIGAICIAPAVLVAALDSIKARVTIGEDPQGLIGLLGGEHAECATDQIIFDHHHNIVSTSAYMREDAISAVYNGIEKLVNKVLDLCE